MDPVGVVTHETLKSRVPKDEIKSLKYTIVVGDAEGDEIGFDEIKERSSHFEPVWLNLDWREVLARAVV
ncbi:MAG: hypothetical protein ACXQTJ_01180 [Candidatus Syntropharchaeales archaeon]